MTRSTLYAAMLLAGSALSPALAQSWTPVTHAPGINAGSAFLLTDGSVLVHDEHYNGSQTGTWKRLVPDINGSYLNGTWQSVASLPTGYAPLYFGSAVLPDGRFIINGGEYNGAQGQVETTLGAIYDPLANTWTNVSPPKGWNSIGDASSIVLANGRYMLANTETSQEAILNLATMTWTPTGSGKADQNSEEGWTLLPDGSLLTVDVFDSQSGTQKAEIYKLGKWTALPNVPVQLADTGYEIGPQVLRPDGTVWCTGATGHSAIYSVASKSFTAGPDFPKVNGVQQDIADGPAVLLPNGSALAVTSHGDYHNGLNVYTFDGTTLAVAANLPNASTTSSYQVRMIILPTGQVLATEGRNDAEILTPSGSANPAWAPSGISVPTTMARGSSYTFSGKQLSGVSQAAAYGDDYSAATNYPIVRLTNVATGHVFYARTSNFSSFAVASKRTATAKVTIPAGAETGTTQLEVVANGIASQPVSVTIQ